MKMIVNISKHLARSFTMGILVLVLASQTALAGSDQDRTEADQRGIYGQQGQQEQSEQQGQQQQSEQQAGQQQSQSEDEVQAFVNVDGQSLPADEIRGREVVNEQGQEVGSVSDVVTDGDETALVVGVGGILGIGSQDILVKTDDIRIADDKVVWETSADKETLKDMPEYDKDTYVSVR